MAQKSLPKEELKLPKPELDLPKPQTDLPLPEKELPSNTKPFHPFRLPLKIFAFLFLLVLFLTSGYVLLQNNAGNTPIIPSPTPVDENTNLKTYINEEENWQIDYPADQNFRILKRESTQIGQNGMGTVVVFSKLGPTQTEGTEIHDGIAFTIGLKQKKSVQTVKEFADEDSKPDPGTTSRTPLKEVTINGHKGIETTVSGLGEARIIYLEYPVYKDRVYYIAIFATGPGETQGEYDTLVENMLQSFKSYR